ncbi:LamG-like jellyroll fold domain-containing protein [Amycolatopsis suaedae]|uniref:LamG domain-containing protein n=1 Tax=Amycolatopsis suaedae TaxID=2510978 RepID=A0A4V2EKX0_9PSEU|nr:LamG-like jellyroll fold domain-containing protein [Amycolatopsis suaedae]RZQ59535.1 LamG domain-containing protein [Amycolatopsis suaedae]
MVGRWACARLRCIASVVTVAVFASLISHGASFASPPPVVESPEVSAALAEARSSGREVAVASLTDEYGEVVAGPDGTLVSRQGLEPERVRRGGHWVPIDLTLEARPDGTVGPKAGYVDVRFSGGGTSGRSLAAVSRDGREVGIGWRGALPAPELNGAVATYRETLPGIDLVLTAKATGYSQVLVVKNAAAAQDPRLREIAFTNHAVGVTTRVNAGGGLEAVDAAGVTHFLGDASKMWDSRGTAGARATGAVQEEPATSTMRVEVTGESVVVRPDQRFLTDPGRVFPVFIDPEYWWAGSKQSHVMVQSRWPDQRNFNRTDGDLADLKAGYQGGYTSRSYFNFSVGAMRGKVIHRATVRSRVLHSWSCGGGPTELWLSGGIGPETTWNNQPGWSPKLGDITRSNHGAFCPSDGIAEVGVTNLMRDAAGGGWTNMVFMLKARNEGNQDDWRRFDLNPVLEVVYNSVPDKPGQLGMENGQIPCVTGENRPFVFTATPRLRGRLTDPDAGMLQARFSLRKGSVGGGTEVWSGQTGNIPSGSFAEVTVPAGVVADEGVYNWSMYASDGGSSSAWVGSCEFSVDKTVPGTPEVSSVDYPTGGDPSGGVGQTGAFTFKSAGTPDVDHYLWSVTEQENDDPKNRVDAEVLGGSASIRWTPTVDGPQTMFVRSVDRAGNRSAIVKYRLNVLVGDPLVANLAGHWKLDGTLADASPHGRALNAVPGTEPTAPGYEGQAVQLDGAGKRLHSTGPVVDTGQSFSVAAWAKLDRVGGWPNILSQDGSRTSGFQLQAAPDGKWAVAMFGQDVDGGGNVQARAYSPGPAQLGVWTHLAGVYDHGAEKLRLYVNGALAGEVGYTSRWSARGDLQVGASLWKGNRGDFFPGAVDDVRAFQRVIVPSEVALLANQPVLRAHYRLAEGTGTVTKDQVSGAVGQLRGTAGWSSDAGVSFTGKAGAEFGVISGPRPELRTDRSYTVSTWVYLDEATTHARTAVAFGGAQYSPFMVQYRPELKRWNFLVSMQSGSGWWIPAGNPVTAGRWVHLTGVYDVAKAEARIYVDGAYAGRVAGVTGWNGPGDLLIGAGRWNSQDADPWDGSIRDVRLYSGVLSDQQIAQLPVASH